VGGAGVLTRLLSFIGCCITGHEGDARNFEVMLQRRTIVEPTRLLLVVSVIEYVSSCVRGVVEGWC
jgi:hypothetical protein